MRKPEKPITAWRVGTPLPDGWAGVPVGSKDDDVYLSNEHIHALVVGTTGSGKTQKIIFPMVYACGHSDESMIITDPKGEIYTETSGFLAKHDYDIVVLNLRDTFHSDSWNIIDTALNYYHQAELAFVKMEQCSETIEKARLLNEAMRFQQEAFEYVNEVSYAITHQHESRDPFWDNAAQGVLTSILFTLVKGKFSELEHQQKNEHRRNLYSAVSILNFYAHTDPEKSLLHAYMQTLPAGDPALNAYSVISRSGAQTSGSIFTALSTATQIFTDQGIAQITAKSERNTTDGQKKLPFNLKDIGMKKTAVFVIFPDEKMSRGLIPALFIDACYKELVTVANEASGRTPVRVNMILDEFAQFPKIADLEKKLAVARSRGIRFTMIIQGFNQLDKVYGKEVAGIIRENCNLLIYLLSGDYETAERICKLIGKQTIKKSSISMGSDDRSSVNLSTDLVQRDLMMPEEILRLGTDVCLVLLTGMQPIKAPIDYYYRFKALQKLKRPTHPLPVNATVNIDAFAKTLPVFDFVTLKENAVALKQAITAVILACSQEVTQAEVLESLAGLQKEIQFIQKNQALTALPPHVIALIAEIEAISDEHSQVNEEAKKARAIRLVQNHPYFKKFKTIIVSDTFLEIQPYGSTFTFEDDCTVAEVAKIFLATEYKHGQPANQTTLTQLHALTEQENNLDSLIVLLSIPVQFPNQKRRETDLLGKIQKEIGR